MAGSADVPAPLAAGHRRNPLTASPRGGRLLSAVQLPWFTALPPRGFGVLTTTGRRTGVERRCCVRVVADGRTAYLASIQGPVAGWVRNLRAEPRVRLRLRSGAFAGTARDLRPDEVERARRLYCDTLHVFDRAEYVMHMPGRPTPERIRALHHHWFATGLPIAVDLVPADR